METLSFLLSYSLTTFLFGIMLVQLLILFPVMDESDDENYHRIYKIFLGFNKKIIIPSMCIELVLDFVLIFVKFYPVPGEYLIRLLIIFLLWGITFVVVTPIYTKLEFGKNANLMKDLRKITWVRAGLWFFRMLIHAIF